MARGINKVIIVGNCGQDPETKYLPTGNAVTTISVATSETWTDKESDVKHERTEWHRIVFFNRLAEIAGEYLRKGSQVYVEGRLQTRKWQDQAGQDRYTTEIIANEMQMLGSSGNGNQIAQQQYNASHPGNVPASTPQPPAQAGAAAPPPAGGDNFDDDIPF